MDKYWYNITFMVEREAERTLIKWLDSDADVKKALDGREWRRIKVVAVPDDPEFNKQALSISLQLAFDSLSASRDWGKSELPKITENFHQQMDGHALHFATILKEV